MWKRLTMVRDMGGATDPRLWAEAFMGELRAGRIADLMEVALWFANAIAAGRAAGPIVEGNGDAVGGV
jgi:hypothetical protein